MADPVDAAEPMEVEDGEGEASSSLQVLTVDVLGTIKAAQAQNGLKHGDYMRYRCVRTSYTNLCS